MQGPPRTFRQRLVSNICQYDFMLYIVFIIEVVLLLFAVLSYLFADLDPGTHTILLIDFFLLGVAFLLTFGLIVVCNKRA